MLGERPRTSQLNEPVPRAAHWAGAGAAGAAPPGGPGPAHGGALNAAARHSNIQEGLHR